MTPNPARPKPAYIRVSAVVAVIIVALFAIDRLLATIERAEIEREAKAQYDTGMSLLRNGKPRVALASLERSHALARTNREYSLGLIEALIADNANGDRSDAESKLREILNANSNDGQANLLLARLLAASSRTDEAIAYYHRAIYGLWRDGDNERPQVRLELARYLAKSHRPQELLSELLLLEDRAPKDGPLTAQLAKLFLVAGSGPRAAGLYRTILRTSPGDPEALRGLGEADFLAGDYRAAESMFLLALKRYPADAALIHRLHFANTLAMLDPTSRRLSSQAKFDRATTLLTAIRSELAACPAAAASPLLSEADQVLASTSKGSITNDLAEARLSLAEKLWDLGRQVCPASLNSEDATAVIMRKLREVQ